MRPSFKHFPAVFTHEFFGSIHFFFLPIGIIILCNAILLEITSGESNGLCLPLSFNFFVDI